jgi:hypothetical protein
MEYNLPRNQRICIIFEKGIGDEFRYIMPSSALSDCRKRYLPAKYTNRQNTLQFVNLFSCKKDIHIMLNLAKYIILYVGELTWVQSD